ncbi:MAG: hypothetical protein AB8B84_03730 [Granulosicoccus sp.]
MDPLLKLRLQDAAATMAGLWWLIVVFFGGISLIAFSQITWSTGEKTEATVLSKGTTEGIAGKETFLIVKTDDGVTSKVTAKGAVSIGERVTLNVFDRVVFRDTYTVD